MNFEELERRCFASNFVRHVMLGHDQAHPVQAVVQFWSFVRYDSILDPLGAGYQIVNLEEFAEFVEKLDAAQVVYDALSLPVRANKAGYVE